MVIWYMTMLTQQGREKRIFNKWNGSDGYPFGKKVTDSYIMSHTKIKSRWIVYLSVKGKIVKLTGDNKGEYIYDFGVGREFLKRTQKALAIKGKTGTH